MLVFASCSVVFGSVGFRRPEGTVWGTTVCAVHVMLTLYACMLSRSVVFGSMGFRRPDGTVCGGDDWLCYQPAQTNFMHYLPGCADAHP